MLDEEDKARSTDAIVSARKFLTSNPEALSYFNEEVSRLENLATTYQEREATRGNAGTQFDRRQRDLKKTLVDGGMEAEEAERQADAIVGAFKTAVGYVDAPQFPHLTAKIKKNGKAPGR